VPFAGVPEGVELAGLVDELEELDVDPAGALVAAGAAADGAPAGAAVA
jgi:hypothetical protein